MKPPDFAYLRPETLDEAIAALAAHGADAKLLAGGQSLMPALNMRLLSPRLLVDINAIAGLDGIRVHNGSVEVGALVRQHAAELSSELGRACPLLGQALAVVAHRPIRTRGTVVGSLAHADPAAELPAVLALLDGTVTARGPEGERAIPADEFFVGYFETSLRPGEIATAATFRAVAAGEGTAFVEMTRRHGDFAVCAVAAAVSADVARVALAGVDERPRVFDVTGLIQEDADAALDALTGGIDPQSDVHASADFRRHLARELTRRAVEQAAARRPAPGALPEAPAIGLVGSDPRVDVRTDEERGA
jgi:carbon-monoxide dehydrogenase medium subunit